MKPRFVLVVSAVLFLAADKPKDDPAKADREKMQGTWAVVLAARRGEALPKEAVDKMKVVITGDKISIQEADGGRAEEAAFKLDPAPKPKTIDFIPAGAPAEKAVPGIYELDGDNLKVCWNKNDNARPTEFATGRDNRHVLFVLKRVK